MNMIENHPFEPFVPEHNEILILGSFPGKESTQTKREDYWFYGASRNQFRKILEKIYGSNLNSTAAKKKLFKDLKIAITDITKEKLFFNM